MTRAVKGRPRKDTQIAQPLNRTVEGSVSGGGFPKTPVVKAVGKKLTPLKIHLLLEEQGPQTKQMWLGFLAVINQILQVDL